MDSAPSSFAKDNYDIDSSPTGPSITYVNNDAQDQFTQAVQLPSTTPAFSQGNAIEENEGKMEVILLAGPSEEQILDHHPPAVQGSSQSGVQFVAPLQPLLWPSFDDGRTLQTQVDSSSSQPDSPVESETEGEEDFDIEQVDAPYPDGYENGWAEGDYVDLDQTDAPHAVVVGMAAANGPARSEEEALGNDRARSEEEVLGDGPARSTLTRGAIRAGVVRQNYHPNGEDNICCICLEGYGEGDVMGKIQCGHEYHYSCIEEWLLQMNNCPVCKRTAV